MTSPWDDLVISGGGRVAVASDELLVHAQLLCRLSFGAKETRACLDSIDAIVDHRTLVASDAPLSAARAEESLDRARLLLGRVELEAERLGRALTVSAELYGVAEHTVEQLGQQLAAAFGYAAGTLFPLFMLYAAPTLSVVAGGLALGAVLAPGGLPATSSGLGTWLRENNRLLTNPATVALIRATVMSSDDFTWGRAGVPAPVVGAMGDEGLQLTGFTSIAGLLTVLGGSAGLLKETPVRVTTTGSATVARGPQGYEERIDRVTDPTARDDGAQIRIERYEIPGEDDRFEIYLAGTVDFSVDPGDEPWDMTSNVNAVAGLPAGSYQAVTEAMRDAGVTPTSPVVFTGYSQGGLIASQLAASGDYNTHGLVTAGAPAGQVQLPEGFPAVVIEHTDDIVPAAGGSQLNHGAIIVERELFAGRRPPTDFAVPAHQLHYYRDTARLLDEAGSAAVVAAIGSLDGFAAGATKVVETTYRAERTG